MFEFQIYFMKGKHNYFLVWCMALIFVSCKKEDSSVSGPAAKCTLSKIVYWNNNFPMTVTKDSAGNITKYGPYDLVQKGDSILFQDPSMRTVWYILHDNLNRPIRYESSDGFYYQLTYNNTKEQPYRISYKSSSDSVETTMLLTYTGNNITQIIYSSNGEDLNLLVDYYPNIDNKLAKQLKVLVPGWSLYMQVPFNFAMLFSNNLVKSISLPQTSEAISYKYQFDNYGNITRERLSFSNTDSLITNYEYDCK